MENVCTDHGQMGRKEKDRAWRHSVGIWWTRTFQATSARSARSERNRQRFKAVVIIIIQLVLGLAQGSTLINGAAVPSPGALPVSHFQTHGSTCTAQKTREACLDHCCVWCVESEEDHAPTDRHVVDSVHREAPSVFDRSAKGACYTNGQERCSGGSVVHRSYVECYAIQLIPVAAGFMLACAVIFYYTCCKVIRNRCAKHCHATGLIWRGWQWCCHCCCGRAIEKEMLPISSNRIPDGEPIPYGYEGCTAYYTGINSQYSLVNPSQPITIARNVTL